MGLGGETAQLVDAQPGGGRLLRGGPAGIEIGGDLHEQAICVAQGLVEHGRARLERAIQDLTADLAERGVACALRLRAAEQRGALVDPGDPVSNAGDQAELGGLEPGLARADGLFDAADLSVDLRRE